MSRARSPWASPEGAYRRVVARRLRINETLCLTETDLDHGGGSILVRHGKNDRRREVG
ncbi:MAG: hypothetical protein JOY58_18680 [Solirubrobacterales bacterium]|nr:hypothetical protein [Solirubrobacterales bacterium]